jgi:two-component system response regulator (stage 0 sporulation protein F)
MARIFLVDDENHIRALYAEELAEVGHQVTTAASGRNLLRKIALLQPEVVVLDIKIGNYDGLELLQDIRNRHCSLPIILCSSYDKFKEDPRSISADYYVVKSFDLSGLKIAIQRAIEAEASILVAKS